MGLKGITRLPRGSQRARRNTSVLGPSFKFILGDGLEIGDDGLFTVIVQDPIFADSSGIGLNYGTGLTLSGTDLTLDILGLTTDTIAAGDWVPFHDLTDAPNKITFANFESTLNHDSLSGFVGNEHIDHTSVTITTGDGLSGGGDISSNRTFVVDLATDPGLEFDSAKLRVKIKAAGGVVRDSDGLSVSVGALAHNSLTGLQGGTAAEYYHLTAAQHTDLTDAGESALHYHDTDRARANHTGSQTAATISDFAEVAQDAVGGILDDGTVGNIAFTYDDGGDVISAVTQDGEIDHDALQNYDANKHVDHTGVTITTGTGLTGGGDISANRTFALDILGLTTDTIAAGDWIPFHDLTDAPNKITFANFEGTLAHDNLSGYVANEHIDHMAVTITTGTGLSGGGDISANRTFVLDILGLTTDTIAAGDWVPFHDLTDAPNKLTFANFEGTLNHDNLASVHQDVNTTASPEFVAVDLTAQNAALMIDGTVIIRRPTAGSLLLGPGTSASMTGDLNTCIGNAAGAGLTSEVQNVYIGSGAGYASTGDYNLGLGTDACRDTTGDFNTCIGYNSGRFIDGGHTGQQNVLIGSITGYDMDGSASHNICLGWSAGRYVTGTANICIGGGAGRLPDTFSGSYNIMVGHEAGPAAAGGALASIIALGAYATPTASHQCLIGSDNANGYIDHVYLGYGVVDASPGDVTIHASGGSGGNNSAGDLYIAGGKSTGVADPGDIIFQTSAKGPSGSTVQTLETRLTLTDTSVDFSGVDVTITNGGGLTFVGTAGLVFGSCYGNDIGWSQAAAAQNTWYNISDASMNSGPLNNVTHDGNGKLTVTEPGMYLVNYSMTFANTSVNDHIEAGIEVTGSGSADAAGQTHTESKFANQEHALSGTAILDLADNATIEVAIRTTDNNTPTLAVEHLNITVMQVGGT